MSRTGRLGWLDGIRGVALAWIFLNHLVERVFGPPLIANPTGDWPPLPVRLDQLAPLDGHGGLDVPLNAPARGGAGREARACRCSWWRAASG